jgi:hypothetical protein
MANKTLAVLRRTRARAARLGYRISKDLELIHKATGRILEGPATCDEIEAAVTARLASPDVEVGEWVLGLQPENSDIRKLWEATLRATDRGHLLRDRIEISFTSEEAARRTLTQILDVFGKQFWWDLAVVLEVSDGITMSRLVGCGHLGQRASPRD